MTATCRIGLAAADITPPAGTPMSGYPQVRRDLAWAPDAMKGYVGRVGVAEGVHDALLASALALEAGGERAVVLALDTLVVTRAFVARLRAALSPHGVPPEHVLVAASHTHAGPDLFGWWEDVDPAVAETTLERAVGSAVEALGKLEDAECAWGAGAVEEVAVNRRDEERGPTDGSVGVLRATSVRTGEAIGFLVGFTCHPVTLDYANLLFSADYVGALRRTLAAVYPGAVTVFVNGAAGNINPARFPYGERHNIYVPQTLENYPVYWGGFADAERLGRMVAGEAIKAAERALPLSPAPIRGSVRPVELPLKDEAGLLEFLDFMNLGSAEYRQGLVGRSRVETDVQTLRLGPLRLVGLPGEPFVEIGLGLKERDPDGGPMLVVGFAGDDVRYVMTDDAYVAGQYETVGTPLGPGSATTLAEHAAALLAAP